MHSASLSCAAKEKGKISRFQSSPSTSSLPLLAVLVVNSFLDGLTLRVNFQSSDTYMGFHDSSNPPTLPSQLNSKGLGNLHLLQRKNRSFSTFLHSQHSENSGLLSLLLVVVFKYFWF
ncbi:hypothetical protein L6164_002262 [Bauhinia variegata]|uniref:Uncharacterized protein n=1 Tax=Bauhinia variegata TaxID=167791 RepID=A0ACB9PXM8_BAUVA|nr:hypothetical protein L6164_002262 [Bauhinia variegata]